MNYNKYTNILKDLNLYVDKVDLSLSEQQLEQLKQKDRDKAELIQNIKTVQKKIAELGNNILDVKQAQGQDIDVYFNRADIYAINQCLHLASSFVLLGSKSEVLSNTIRQVREDCQTKQYDVDPTTIISVAALYYLLIMDQDSEHKDGINGIKDRFTGICWMVGSNVRQQYLQIT